MDIPFNSGEGDEQIGTFLAFTRLPCAFCVFSRPTYTFLTLFLFQHVLLIYGAKNDIKIGENSVYHIFQDH